MSWKNISQIDSRDSLRAKQGRKLKLWLMVKGSLVAPTMLVVYNMNLLIVDFKN